LGITCGAQQLAILVHYLELLEKWNRTFNLTGLSNPEDMVTRHILDSLAVRPFIAGERLLDVGTGPGLPGIPLAVVDPGLRVTLLDSNGKKVRFLRHVVGELPLRNATVTLGRVEHLDADGSFDTAICRALGSLAQFASSCGRLLRSGGRLVAMKGRLPTDEMNAVDAAWRLTAARVAVPGLDAERHVIVMER
jgi:16S rRNA (guanine527-N7)-methyltransferase